MATVIISVFCSDIVMITQISFDYFPPYSVAQPVERLPRMEGWVRCRGRGIPSTLEMVLVASSLGIQLYEDRTRHLPDESLN